MTERTRNGIVERCRDAKGRVYFRGRLILQDGSLSPRIPIPEEKRFEKKAARNYVAFRQEAEDDTHAIYLATLAGSPAASAAASGETCDAWFMRYNAHAKSIGQTDAAKKADRWNKWIAPIIGPKPIGSVSRDDVEDIRDGLDAAIEEWKRLGKSAGKKGRAISGKTAMNVWSCLTSSFKAATASKRRELRVLDGKPSPCAGVEPPGDSASRQSRRKTFLYPREATALLGCEVIEIEWREVYAVALYLYMRPGELRVLTWGDVDLEIGIVSVDKAWDYEEARIKPPKTRNGVRKIPIEPTLAPLLARLKQGCASSDLVVPALAAFGEDHLAELWRKHLKVAKLERAELHTSTRTHVQSNFRSCRDSGITWLALGGIDVTKMMRRAGHDHVQTTMGYVRLAEDLAGDLGTPFGPVPESLTEPEGSTAGSTLAETIKKSVIFSAGGGSRNRTSEDADAEKRAPTHDAPATAPRATTRNDVERHPSGSRVDLGEHARHVDQPDPIDDAMDRELARARAERRWVDADEIARDLAAHRATIRSPVIDLAARRARK